jgi:hypothetical protein
MTIHQEFQLECQAYAASVALAAAENLTVSKRLMLYQGILPLLPEGSDARLHAQGGETTISQLGRFRR